MKKIAIIETLIWASDMYYSSDGLEIVRSLSDTTWGSRLMAISWSYSVFVDRAVRCQATGCQKGQQTVSPVEIYYSAETLNWTFVCKLWSTTWTLNFNISLYWILPNCVSTLDLTNYPGGHFLTATIHPSLLSIDFIWYCHRSRSYILNSVIHRRFCDIVRLLTFLYKREKHGINATVKNILYLLKVSRVSREIIISCIATNQVRIIVRINCGGWTGQYSRNVVGVICNILISWSCPGQISGDCSHLSAVSITRGQKSSHLQ